MQTEEEIKEAGDRLYTVHTVLCATGKALLSTIGIVAEAIGEDEARTFYDFAGGPLRTVVENLTVKLDALADQYNAVHSEVADLEHLFQVEATPAIADPERFGQGGYI